MLQTDLVFVMILPLWSSLLNILPAVSKLNLGSDAIAFIPRPFCLESGVYLELNFHRGREELNPNDSNQ